MTHNSTFSGGLVIDKPAGPTSHDIVQKVRSLLTPHQPRPRVGHTGTLDPFATGLLLLAIGSTTRLISFTHQWSKTYQATITLGASSTTDDITGDKTTVPTASPPTQTDVLSALNSLTGVIQQTPPAYAAVKIKGQRLYKYARRGEYIKPPPRPVTIHEINLEKYEYPQLKIRVRCGTGTYIRALGRDLGLLLNTAAYVSSLRRTKIGPVDISEAIKPNKLSTSFPQALKSPAMFVQDLESMTLSNSNVAQLKQGRELPLNTPLHHNQLLAIYDSSKNLASIARYHKDSASLSPHLNL